MNFLFPFNSNSNHQNVRTIVDTAIADGRFKTLVSALQRTDLVSTLQGQGPFTVFAPTDDAFAMLDLSGADIETLKNVLLYHVVAGYFTSSNLKSVLRLKTVQGLPIDVRVDNGKIYVNGAQVIISDIKTSNGIIHVIDSVLELPMDNMSQRNNMNSMNNMSRRNNMNSMNNMSRRNNISQMGTMYPYNMF